jgi:hypothetical protein
MRAVNGGVSQWLFGGLATTARTRLCDCVTVIEVEALLEGGTVVDSGDIYYCMY